MSDSSNPFDSPRAQSVDASPTPGSRGWKPTWIEILVVFGIIAILVGLLLPTQRGVSTAGRRMQSANNLKQIGLALHNYHDTFGSFPPAVMTDADGKPLYSWRVMVLPFVEAGALYEQFALDEPWDSPHNLPLLKQMPQVFGSPYRDLPTGDTNTPYVALVDAKEGRTAMLPARGRTFDEISDGPSNTGMVIDDPAHMVPWTAPRDCDPVELLGRVTLNESKLQGIHLLKCDGSITWLGDQQRPDLVGYLLCDDGRVPQN